MTLERVGDDLYATGPTVGEDFIRFKEALGKGGVQRLILVNAPGGDLWTGMRVARMVQDAKIKTIISGHCISACSLIFIAGQTRAFGTGHLPRVTLLGIHGAHDTNTKQVIPAAMPQMYALYKTQLGEKFDSDVINQALYDIKDAGGLLRVREVQRNKEGDQSAWFCPSAQTPFAECQQHTGKNAFKLGLVTQIETEQLELPASMQTQPSFFGRPLTATKTDLSERAGELIQTLCGDGLACKAAAEKLFTNYLSGNTNKAIATGWGKGGYGYRWGVDDAGTAMLGALYGCNHAKNNPKLCRLVSVNDHELLNFYIQEQAPANISALLANLKPPTPDAVQAEREEVGAGTPSALRPHKDAVGMTPRALTGVQRWDTADLVKALSQSSRPVMIDVAAQGPMIPGALNFIHGGLAFDKEEQEQAYAERFRQMLQIAAPDLAQPVVFYCASSECWLSVNAAMRAQKLGYTQAIWYRGGQSAWLKQGLPTVARLPVAVLY